MSEAGGDVSRRRNDSKRPIPKRQKSFGSPPDAARTLDGSVRRHVANQVCFFFFILWRAEVQSSNNTYNSSSILQRRLHNTGVTTPIPIERYRITNINGIYWCIFETRLLYTSKQSMYILIKRDIQREKSYFSRL